MDQWSSGLGFVCVSSFWTAVNLLGEKIEQIILEKYECDFSAVKAESQVVFMDKENWKAEAMISLIKARVTEHIT